jgi:hypothetical protein
MWRTLSFSQVAANCLARNAEPLSVMTRSTFTFCRANHSTARVRKELADSLRSTQDATFSIQTGGVRKVEMRHLGIEED